jgi:hypothetical protein
MTSRKRWSRWGLILPLLLAAGSLADAATTTSHFRVKGDTVTAVFFASDPVDPCVEIFVSVVASDLIEIDKPGRRAFSFNTVLTVAMRDSCTGFIFFSGEGTGSNTTFRAAGDLRSSTLTAEVPVFDEVNGQTSIFQVNLNWEATADAEFIHFKETFRDPDLGIRIITQSVSTLGQATATGTVFGAGKNVTPEPSDTATIQKDNFGTLMLQKTR